MDVQPTIVIHGGAGAYLLINDGISKTAIEDGVIASAVAGYQVLKDGGSALDAAQAAIVCMEDNPIFNCGHGSFLTVDHKIEMDASVMDGADLSTGAVACITNVKNPVLVARAVKDKTRHTLFCGEAATSLALAYGCQEVTTESLTTEKALCRLAEKASTNERSPVVVDVEPNLHDTVGAVSLDCRGNVAYATSTGGISGKMSGRVGDSPIVGSGGYADNKSGAVTTTGDGEAFVKMCTAKHVSMLMEQGIHPQVATKTALDRLQSRLPSSAGGGCIAVDTHGNMGVGFNTGGMAWATIQGDIIRYGIYQDEVHEKRYVKDDQRT